MESNGGGKKDGLVSALLAAYLLAGGMHNRVPFGRGVASWR